MPRYYFDVHDREGLTSDETGETFENLHQVGEYALSVLPDLARDDNFTGGHQKSVLVRVRSSDGSNIFRASLVLSSAWLVDEVDGFGQPGEDRLKATMTRLAAVFRTIRRDLFDDRMADKIAGIDTLIGIAQGEIDKLLKTSTLSQQEKAL